jgi:general secretion pathway protein E
LKCRPRPLRILVDDLVELPAKDASMSSPASTITILSAPGSKYAAPEEIRHSVIYTSEGIVVDAARRFDPGVMNYLARLRTQGVLVEPTYATAERIAELHRIGQVHRNAEKADTVDTSSQQRAVIARIREAQLMDASDVHLICNNKTGHARFEYRIHGDLVIPPRAVMTYEEGKSFANALYNTMTDVAQGSNFNERKPQDARFKGEVLSAVGVYGARVATRPTDNGFVMVLRILKAADDKMQLDGLGYLKPQIEDLIAIMDHSYGLCLISGPTGSGKSRTLQVMLSEVIKRTEGRERVITLEQPCEYEIPGAIQTPVDVVKDESGREYADFAGGVRNLLRLDPDCIMVGELRDHESAVSAFEAAQTGHTVFSTIHANGAFEIPSRLIGEPISLPRDRVLDPTLMKGMVGQRLVQLLCEDCKQPILRVRETLKSGLFERLADVLNPRALSNVYVRGRNSECKTCKGRGVVGRQVVAEVVRTNMALLTAFDTKGHVAARKEWIEKNQGISMKMHALLLVAQGRVDPADAEASVDLLDEEIRGLGIQYPESIAGEAIFRQPGLKVVGGGFMT